ncbi:MAG: N-acyl homoserine lactonase family protein [Candidatus Nanopelagicales bacterium]
MPEHLLDVGLRRVDFGWFVRPGSETESGEPRVEAVLGYAVEHAGGVLLVDTGMGSHPEVDAHYRPRTRSLDDALHASGLRRDAITEVVNCHLHFDHCGGNPLLAGRPFFVQATELAEARAGEDYTLPELVDPPGTAWEVLDGEAEILPGVRIVPTPGHTAGHQSVVVRRSDGVVVVAGQSHGTAFDYASDVLALRARRAGHDEPLPVAPEWMAVLEQLDPRYVVFAHDHSVWVP